MLRQSAKPLIISLSILAIIITFVWSDKPSAIAHSTRGKASKTLNKTLKPALKPMMMQAGGQCAAPSFSGPTHFTVDSGGNAEEAPIFVATGDFDNDNDLDLATANTDTTNITVLLGNGLGGFGASASFNAGANPFALAVGDFNEDTDLDIAVSNFGSGNVSILLGDGAGGFSAPTNFTVGAQPTGIAVGDFNEDNNLDLVVASFSNGNIALLLGNGAGSFGAATNFGAGNGPFSLVVGDFNSNNNLDVAVANALGNNVSVLLGNGAGSFGAATNFGVGTGPAFVTTADIDNDTDLDLVTANQIGNNISVLLNNGAGTFGAATNFAVGANAPFSVALDDFNFDGNIDAATANTNSDNVSVLLGNGLGGFGAATLFNLAPGGDDPRSIAVGDFDGNGRPDLATANAISDNVSILLNTCSPPTITAVGVTREQGAPVSNSIIANVNDAEDLENNLVVTVNGAASATVGGVTVSNIVVSPAGVVTADVVASCMATIGNIDFTLLVTDTAGNFAEDTLTVTVTPDATAPVITCPANISVNNDPGQCSAVVNFIVTATDACTMSPTIVATPPSGTAFPVGTTTVNATATDALGNSSSCSFTVTVNDVEAPTVTCPANVTVSNDLGLCSAVVNFNATATDNCPGAIVTCVPASGSAFPVGTTSVTCSATDASGNPSASSCSFTVTVNDTQPPVITCPANITVSNAPDQCSAVVNFNVMASDNCPGVALMVAPPSGSTFPVGTTTVTALATDASGNTASCSFTVTVNDTQPPAITCPPSVIGMSGIVTFADPVVTDNCAGASFVCVPPSGSSFPIGTTTVTCTATDGVGNTASCSFVVATFDICLQDDSQPLNKLLFRSTTGDYIFCCSDGTTFTGKGTVTKKGVTFSLVHNTSQRRVQATATLGTVNKGNASIQAPPGVFKCGIADTNTTNNTCVCGSIN